MRGMLALTPGAGEGARSSPPSREMYRGVQCDLTGIVSRAGVVAGDMSTDGTGPDGTGTGNGA